MNLQEYLSEYKALTLDIMEQINIDGNIKFILIKRQDILNKVMGLDYNKEQLEQCVKSLRLLELDKEMNLMIKNEMINIKKKLNNLKKRQQANQQYLYTLQKKYDYSRLDKRF